MDLNMGVGKVVSQCCHACLFLYRRAERMTSKKYQELLGKKNKPKSLDLTIISLLNIYLGISFSFNKMIGE